MSYVALVSLCFAPPRPVYPATRAYNRGNMAKDEHARDRYPDAPMVQLDLKGKSEPVAARIVDLNARAPA